MSNTNSVLLDTYALIAYFQDEPSANKIGKYIDQIESGRINGYISCISITEILSRVGLQNPKMAYMILAYLEESPIKILPIGLIEARHAGNIKLKYKHLKLSIADVLIIASSMLNEIDLTVTGDDDWEKLEEINVLQI